ncbi:hypothetical protein EXD82_07995 [Peptacetobacter hominis]|uniref:DUF2628 domain-containing protein n=1 Tax=Peptacetobacter hominis TaxID=2743610 RepID=A0A544QTW5_9FIRM|nr:hypothetical protein [Peptacetobacter hominis]TQQ84141.1 hypothetical protein EXD82_07995 [Peptacetobacter hominis]
MQIYLKNDAGVLKECKIGFSWTTFFFGFFVPIFRGDWKWMLIMLIAAPVTFGISSIVFAFIYNKIYIKDLLEKGFMPMNDSDREALAAKGYIVME